MLNKIKIVYNIDKLTDCCFYLLAAAVTFSNSFTEIATAAIIGLWFIRVILNKSYKNRGGIISIIFGLFVIWNSLSLVNTAYLNESIRGFSKVIKHGLIFLATVDHFRSAKNIQRLLIFTVSVGFLVSLNGIVQYITGTDLIRQRTIDPLDYLHRVSSSFVHSNDFGAYLVVIIGLLFSMFFTSQLRLRERALLSLVSFPIGWSLVATSSRGAWLGAVVALLYMVVAKSRRLALIILMLCIIMLPFLPNFIKERFSDFAEIGTREGTVWERLKLWEGTLDMIKEHPFLGFGVNTYTRNFPKHKPKDYPDIRYTHNSYLQMAAEIGIVGAGIFILFLVILIVSAHRAIGFLDSIGNYKAIKEPHQYQALKRRFLESGLKHKLHTGLLAGVIGFLIHCAVDTHFYSVTLSAFLFLYLGILVSFCKIAYEQNS